METRDWLFEWESFQILVESGCDPAEVKWDERGFWYCELLESEVNDDE